MKDRKHFPPPSSSSEAVTHTATTNLGMYRKVIHPTPTNTSRTKEVTQRRATAQKELDQHMLALFLFLDLRFPPSFCPIGNRPGSLAPPPNVVHPFFTTSSRSGSVGRSEVNHSFMITAYPLFY